MKQNNAIHRNVTPTFAIIVDGETEMWYFHMLKRNEKAMKVNLFPMIPQKKTLLQQFETVKSSAKEHTKVFWIIDLDVILKENKERKSGKETPLQQLEKYRKQLEKRYKNVVVIANNPCLEFWFLLHFDFKPITSGKCADAESALKKHLPDYKKQRIFFTQQNDIYQKLKEKLKVGIKNAKNLGNFDAQLPEKPVCELYKFFEAKELESIFKEYLQ